MNSSQIQTSEDICDAQQERAALAGGAQAGAANHGPIQVVDAVSPGSASGIVYDYNVGSQYFGLLDLNNTRATLPFLASHGAWLRIREKTRDDITGQYTGRERWAKISDAEIRCGRTVCRLTELNAEGSRGRAKP